MSFSAKLALFWIAILLVLAFIAFRPRSFVTRLLLTWHGPTPRDGERKSRYQLRWCLYSLICLVQIVLVFAIGYIASVAIPELMQSMFVMALIIFVLPLLGGMALLGALGALVASMKTRFVGPDPVWSPDSPQ
ncbi:hypothetical protein [Pseudomonas sp. BN515]|uniref:hypothetical protein n=1 Tax=Pseudomonas sp. BN515 TaxID=2567892 RepID=UPI00245503CA|nr:hypothetical protein [Pseudomonas sp. BN515]